MGQKGQRILGNGNSIEDLYIDIIKLFPKSCVLFEQGKGNVSLYWHTVEGLEENCDEKLRMFQQVQLMVEGEQLLGQEGKRKKTGRQGSANEELTGRVSFSLPRALKDKYGYCKSPLCEVDMMDQFGTWIIIAAQVLQ